MPLTVIVTNAGRAALVNAANTGTAPVTIAEVGLSATAVAPSAAAAALPGEFKRLATLSGDVVADDTIHLIVRDEGNGVFTVRSLALYLADGTLFAIYGQADVLIEKSAQAMMLLAIDVQFADIDAATLTFGDANFLNPPATTTTQGIVELATTAEAQAGIDALRALTPTTAKAAILGWLLAQDGAGSGIDADLLDGQHGSYYADIAARLGFTPVNKAGDTMTGLLTLSGDPTATGHAARKAYVDALVTAAALLAKLVTVDGAGSGLDADLLDGQHGAYYADIPTRLGFNPLNAATYTALDVRGKLITVDGSGSGVDADLLDGQEGSYYRDLGNSTGILPNARLSGLYTGLKLEAVPNSTWIAGSTWGLNLRNSDILGANGIFFSNDTSNLDEEGLNFLKGGAPAASQDLADYDNLRGPGNGTLLWNGSVLFHAGNDGAGSGMDADLLDGQQGSYYTAITARLGYTPLDATDYTAADVKAKLLTVDGAGSGFDADLLDGQQGSYYTAITARLGYTPLDVTDYTAADVKAKLLTVDGSGSGFDADLLDGQHGSYYRDLTNSTGILPNARFSGTYDSITEMGMSRIRLTSGSDVSLGSTGHAFQIGLDAGSNIVADANEIQARMNGGAGNLNLNLEGGDVIIGSGSGTAWHSANDGAGSGMDADLLDGYQGSAYDRIVSQSLVENGGYVTYASGRKECWGIVNITVEDSYYTVNLPVAHTDWVLPIGDGMTLSSAAQENTAVRDIQYDGSGNPISFRIYNAAGTGGGFPFRWRSIGK